MNTLSKTHTPSDSGPSRDDDPTGVRALLSSLPAPDPMPAHLVARITASLAAEQTQRATEISGTPVTPLIGLARRRPARIVFAIAGAAAAVAVIAVYSASLFTTSQMTTISGSATLARSSSPAGTSGGSPPSAAYKAPAAAGSAAAAPLIQIRGSGTRYTQAGFAAQAQTLRDSAPGPIPSQPSESSGVEPAATASGLRQCLNVIGAAEAQMVRADVAFYEGQPAVIIVATTNGRPVAYAVGRQCSYAKPVVLRPATPLS